MQVCYIIFASDAVIFPSIWPPKSHNHFVIPTKDQPAFRMKLAADPNKPWCFGYIATSTMHRQDQQQRSQAPFKFSAVVLTGVWNKT